MLKFNQDNKNKILLQMKTCLLTYWLWLLQIHMFLQKILPAIEILANFQCYTYSGKISSISIVHQNSKNFRRMILTWGSSTRVRNKLQENPNFFWFVLWSDEATFKSILLNPLIDTICTRSQLTLDENCRSTSGRVLI